VFIEWKIKLTIVFEFFLTVCRLVHKFFLKFFSKKFQNFYFADLFIKFFLGFFFEKISKFLFCRLVHLLLLFFFFKFFKKLFKKLFFADLFIFFFWFFFEKFSEFSYFADLFIIFADLFNILQTCSFLFKIAKNPVFKQYNYAKVFEPKIHFELYYVARKGKLMKLIFQLKTHC